MARARNIKPGIMENETLADLSHSHRLLFIYLWMLADREGRLEDRPKRIAVQAFPYDDIDVDAMLSNLADKGFLSRYVANDIAVIQIAKFAKHQAPHVREKASELPEPVQGSAKAVQGTEQGSAEASPRSPDSLIEDSLIPDSPKPEDQHHSLNAGEHDSVSEAVIAEEFEGFGDLEEIPEETPEQPVDPKAPVEMTLDWKPDAKLLKTYAVHFGVPVDAFTPESIASFTAHHETNGTLNTQSKWVSLLAKWVRDDKNKASNVRQFPAKAASSRHHGFAERDYTAGLKVREDGTYAL